MSTPNSGINGTLGTGLIAHWSFDNGSSLDESGNGTVLNQTGTPSFSNNKVYIPNPPASTIYANTLIDKTSDIGFSLFFDNTSIQGDIITTGRNYPAEMYIAKNNATSINVCKNSGQNVTCEILEGVNHVCGSVGTGIFLNGLKICEWTKTLNGFKDKVSINGGYGFHSAGTYDELRIYNRVLTQSEILELYEMGVNYMPKCETPVATPSGGSYTEAQTVELSCSTPSSTIYYTTNGVDPDDNETLYSQPIEISENTILKVIAYATGYEPSDILTEIYNIEGGNLKMEETQSAGLLALFWKPTGSAVETVLGEVPLDGQEVLSMQEVINFFNTKYAGNHPVEARVTAGASTFTVDLIESPTLRALLSNTTVTSGTKTIIGLNTGKTAITGQLRLHPMYNGADLSEDIFLLKVAPAITDERTFATENGRKLIKVVFTVMGVKTNLATPAVTDFVTPTSGSISYKMLNANDLGTSAASAAETGAATGDLTFIPGTGTNRVIFYKSTDAFATYAATFYYEVSEAEFAAKSFATGTAAWVALTSAEQLAAIPAAATGYYYKAIEIGV